MKFNIYSFGRAKYHFLVEGELEYLKRLRSECKVNLIELESHESSSASPAVIKLHERQALFERIKDNDFLVVLDENGQGYSSAAFAEFIKKCFDRGISVLNFAIGGPEGWDAAVLQRADVRLSLSPMTFTSQIARFILVEQLYRALRIIKGGAYPR